MGIFGPTLDINGRNFKMFRFALIASLIFIACPVHGQEGDCMVYDQGSENCADSCAACFNPGSRSGVMCRAGDNGGYYCPADSSEDMAYACMGQQDLKPCKPLSKLMSREQVNQCISE